MLVVVRCVVLCVVIRASLATILVVTIYQQTQNGQFVHNHITKLANKHPKYNWMCKLVIIQRSCTHFDFLVQKLFGPCHERAKKFAENC
jgi:hypothetical protein